MPREYDIIINGRISIGGKFEGETVAAAIDVAKQELRRQGEISDIEVERALYLDPNEDMPSDDTVY